MSYKKADKILPKEVLELIQQYVEGETIYIPRRPESRRSWGSSPNPLFNINTAPDSITTQTIPC